jgi:hypothetical protein
MAQVLAGQTAYLAGSCATEVKFIFSGLDVTTKKCVEKDTHLTGCYILWQKMLLFGQLVG